MKRVGAVVAGQHGTVLSGLAVLGTVLLTLAAAPAQAVERRCGWLDNPTPNNLWLHDAAGAWTLSTQGMYEAEGLDRLPSRDPRRWVVTNGSSYGYGCVCLQVEPAGDRNTGERRIRRVLSGTTEALGRCRHDPKLPAMPTGRPLP